MQQRRVLAYPLGVAAEAPDVDSTQEDAEEASHLLQLPEDSGGEGTDIYFPHLQFRAAVGWLTCCVALFLGLMSGPGGRLSLPAWHARYDAHLQELSSLPVPDEAFAHPAEPLQTKRAQGHLCVGVTIYLRDFPYVTSLINSMTAHRARRQWAHHSLRGSSPSLSRHDSLSTTVSPHSLSIYWLPGNTSAAAMEQAPVWNLQYKGYDVVRVDELLSDAGSPSTARITPPHMYGAVLRDLQQRHSDCRAYLVVEDDVIAAVEWEQELGTALHELQRRDGHWRLLKLFFPDVFSGWSFIHRPTDFLVVLFPSVAVALLMLAAMQSVPIPFSKRSKLCSALVCFLGTAATLILRGRQALPCALNADSCAGLYASNQICCTQSHVYSPSMAPALSECLLDTFLPANDQDAFRFQVDLAMYRCMVMDDTDLMAHRYADGLTCPAQNRGVKSGCFSTALDIFFPNHGDPLHTYELRPYLFQHVGLMNSYGTEAPLRSSSMWLDA